MVKTALIDSSASSGRGPRRDDIQYVKAWSPAVSPGPHLVARAGFGRWRWVFPQAQRCSKQAHAWRSELAWRSCEPPPVMNYGNIG